MNYALDRNFHFAFPAATVYHQLRLLRSFSAFVPEPKNRTRPAEPLPEPKVHDLPHSEAISQTPLPPLPSVVQIGFAWLPRLYAAWRTATAAVRERLLDEPQLFLKTQREHAMDLPSPAMVELGRDLEVVVAIARRPTGVCRAPPAPFAPKEHSRLLARPKLSKLS